MRADGYDATSATTRKHLKTNSTEHATIPYRVRKYGMLKPIQNRKISDGDTSKRRSSSFIKKNSLNLTNDRVAFVLGEKIVKLCFHMGISVCLLNIYPGKTERNFCIYAPINEPCTIHSLKKMSRPLLFWNVTQRRSAIIY